MVFHWNTGCFIPHRIHGNMVYMGFLFSEMSFPIFDRLVFSDGDPLTIPFLKVPIPTWMVDFYGFHVARQIYQSHGYYGYCWWFRNPKANHLRCIKPNVNDEMLIVIPTYPGPISSPIYYVPKTTSFFPLRFCGCGIDMWDGGGTWNTNSQMNGL